MTSSRKKRIWIPLCGCFLLLCSIPSFSTDEFPTEQSFTPMDQSTGSTQTQQGSFTTSIQIEVPAGPAGIKPDIRLTYSSFSHQHENQKNDADTGVGDGSQVGPVGRGWSLTSYFVEDDHNMESSWGRPLEHVRGGSYSVNGAPAGEENGKLYTLLSGHQTDITPSNPRQNSYANFQMRQANGSTWYYGQNNAPAWDLGSYGAYTADRTDLYNLWHPTPNSAGDNQNGCGSQWADGEFSARAYLRRIVDAHGNEIRYTYKSEVNTAYWKDGHGCGYEPIKYIRYLRPSEITWGSAAHKRYKVLFNYENKPGDWDKWSYNNLGETHIAPTFSGKRLAEVDVLVKDQNTWHLLRRYRLTHDSDMNLTDLDYLGNDGETLYNKNQYTYQSEAFNGGNNRDYKLRYMDTITSYLGGVTTIAYHGRQNYGESWRPHSYYKPVAALSLDDRNGNLSQTLYHYPTWDSAQAQNLGARSGYGGIRFTGFDRVEVTLPDGSKKIHKYFTTNHENMVDSSGASKPGFEEIQQRGTHVSLNLNLGDLANNINDLPELDRAGGYYHRSRGRDTSQALSEGQLWALSGLEYETIWLKSDQTIVSTEQHIYNAINVRHFPQNRSYSARNQYQLHKVKSLVNHYRHPETHFFNGTRASHVVWQEADRYGNTVRLFESDQPLTHGTWYRKTVSLYYPNTQAWILNKPGFQNVYAFPGNESNWDDLAQSVFYIYGTNTSFNQPQQATLTQEWVNHPTKSPIKTKHVYDTRGNLTETLNSLNVRVLKRHYDPHFHDRLDSAEDVNGNTTTFVYDSLGRATQEIDKNGLVTRRYFDLANRNYRTDLPNGNFAITHYKFGTPSYDQYLGSSDQGGPIDHPGNRVNATVSFLGEGLISDAQGDRIDTSKPYEQTHHFSDGLGRKILTTSRNKYQNNLADAAIKKYVAFNAAGQVQYESDPHFAPYSDAYAPFTWDPVTDNGDGNCVEYTYDLAGRPSTVNHPMGDIQFTGYGWAGGNPLSRIHWKGHHDVSSHLRTDRNSDVYGRLVEVVEKGSNATGDYLLDQKTEYFYDVLDRLTSVKDARGTVVTTITWDEFGHMTAMDDADLGTWSYAYDGNGRLESQTDATGKTTEFHYDSMDRITKTIFSDGTEDRIYYDDPNHGLSVGKPTRYTGPGGTENIFYDELGRPHLNISQIGPIVGFSQRVFDDSKMGREYRSTGKSGHTTDAIFDIYDRRIGTQGYVQNTEWNARGQVTALTWANDVSVNHTYDDNGRLSTRTSSNQALDLSYTYDPLKAQIQTRTLNGHTITYGYDDLLRLTSATGAGVNESYGYDEVGRMNGSTYSNAHPYHAPKNPGYVYDQNGNLTQGNGYEIKYTAFNKPAAITFDDGTPVNPQALKTGYGYKGKKRVIKNNNGQTTYYQGGQLVDEGAPRLSYSLSTGAGSKAYDGSGSNHHGTLNGSPTWSEGHTGQGLAFDGINDWIRIPSVQNLALKSFTLSVWVNTEIKGPGKRQGIVRLKDGNGKWLRLFINPNLVEFDIYPGEIGNLTTAIETNQWEHFAATYEHGSDTARLYRNGELVQERISAGMAMAAITEVHFGWKAVDQHFQGSMDEFKVYDYPLSAQAIRNLAQMPGNSFAALNFSEGKGTQTYDVSGQYQNATIHGATWTDGFTGSALSFDGQDDHVELELHAWPVVDQFTVSAWIRGDANQESGKHIYVASRRKSFGVRTWTSGGVGNAGLILRNAADTSWVQCNSGMDVLDGNWHHLAGTYDGSHIRFYVDGVLKKTVAHSGGIYASSDPTLIGGMTSYSRFNGSVDQVRLFNRALTPLQIQAQAEKAGRTLATWGFSEGFGDVSYDKSDQINHVSLENHDFTHGYRGYGLQLFSNSQVTPNQPSLAGRHTLSLDAWVRPDASQSGVIYSEGGTQAQFKVSWNHTQQSLTVAIHDQVQGWKTLTTPHLQVRADQWSHIAFTLHPTQSAYLGRIYTNGQLVAEGTMQHTAPYHHAAAIGREVGLSESRRNNQFRGVLDEFQLYSYALSSAQIQELASIMPTAVASYSFSNGNGDFAFDTTVNDHHLYLQGAMWTKGIAGNALDFDGINDYADIGPLPYEHLTFAAWFQTDSISGNHPIISNGKDSGAALFLEQDRLTASLSIGGQTYQVQSNTTVTTQRWHHAAATYDGQALTLFLNGQQEAQIFAAGKLDGRLQDFLLGRQEAANSGGKPRLGVTASADEYWAGQLDEVRVFNMALSQAQIQRVMGEQPLRSRGTGAGGVIVDSVYGKLFPLRDTQGSPVEVLDQSGTVKESIRYDSFGNTVSDDNQIVTAHKFNGKERDLHGLYDYDARMYNPEDRIFLQADTITPTGGMDPQSLNRYAYARNNPINRIDPDGHDDKPNEDQEGESEEPEPLPDDYQWPDISASGVMNTTVPYGEYGGNPNDTFSDMHNSTGLPFLDGLADSGADLAASGAEGVYRLFVAADGSVNLYFYEYSTGSETHKLKLLPFANGSVSLAGFVLSGEAEVNLVWGPNTDTTLGVYAKGKYGYGSALQLGGLGWDTSAGTYLSFTFAEYNFGTQTSTWIATEQGAYAASEVGPVGPKVEFEHAFPDSGWTQPGFQFGPGFQPVPQESPTPGPSMPPADYQPPFEYVLAPVNYEHQCGSTPQFVLKPAELYQNN